MMSLNPADFEQGVLSYWREIDLRSREVQERERSFPQLAQRFGARHPPHFTRAEVEDIIRWKYTDRRRCKRALDALAQVPENRIRDLTGAVHGITTAHDAARALRGAIRGVGIAGISAILAAARPDLFPVIDVFALTAICHHYDLPWLRAVPRDAEGRFSADEKSYAPYTQFCRDHAAELSISTGQPWTPRRVDMALWGIGKQLIETRLVRSACVMQSTGGDDDALDESVRSA